MNHQDDIGPLSLREAEVAEEFALHRVLKRTRLEEAAANPFHSFKLRWNILRYLLLGGIFIYLEIHHINYTGLIAFILLTSAYSALKAVHSRIDAILELEKMKSGDGLQIATRQADQDDAPTSDKPPC